MKSCSEENKDGDETPPSVTLTSPTHYRTVLERNRNCGGKTEDSAAHAGSSLHHNHLNEHDSRVLEALEMATQTSTAASRARDKSNAAIARHLEIESNTESHDPRIADSWVDRRTDDCSGDMDEHSVARLAVGMHVAPSLIHNVCHEHAIIESSDGDDTTRGGTATTTKAMSAEVAMLIEEHAAHNVLQWDDTSPNHDFRYQSDAAAHHSSIGAYDEPNDSKDTVIMLLDTDGTKPSASRPQTTQQTSYFASSSTDTSMMSNDSSERHSHGQTHQPRFVQAASASQPFLCDLLHDSHGVGIDPSGSSPAFSASSCAELLVFNSNTSVYGRHREVPEFDTEAVRTAFADVTLRPKNSSPVIKEGERDGVSAADVIDLRTQLPTIRFTDDEGSSTDNHNANQNEQEQQDNGTDELRTDETSGHETNNESSGNDVDDCRISSFRNKTVNLNFYEPIPDDSDKLKLPESLPLA
eukprot:CAMPEP_0194368480 /NCGR_PEP_ID=MMETSP0174-20130528/16728_1 /TAXON_ID=216777 /ORGANISM="Proboscia alata, Strain PI-D3" /LENGTH=468 /DNA_ID=CAMNT_0039144881 /DNA_START=347 /DNA_END=1753 /DNA_ORIENTATION=-